MGRAECRGRRASRHPISGRIAIAVTMDLEFEEVVGHKQLDGPDDVVNGFQATSKWHLYVPSGGGLCIAEVDQAPGNMVAGHALTYSSTRPPAIRTPAARRKIFLPFFPRVIAVRSAHWLDKWFIRRVSS
jgi:hypothetical protein